MPTTWTDLKASITATGRYDVSLIMRLALAATRQEIAACRSAGIARTFGRELSYQLTLAWQRAKTYRDDFDTARMLASASPAERTALRLEARAELAETCIPPNRRLAADFRAQAAVCRAASWRPLLTDDDFAKSIQHAAE